MARPQEMFRLYLTGFIALALWTLSASAACSDVLVRKEWAELFDNQKREYLSAVTCLQSQPPKLQELYPGVRSRYDDYVAAHINKTSKIYFTGTFHPWHRRFLASFESDLRSLCNYTGAQPYWDWTLDADLGPLSFVDSPVFRVQSGFGGNAPLEAAKYTRTTLFPEKIPDTTGGGCLDGGPFAGVSVNVGPGPSVTHNPRCLTRDFAPALAASKLNSTIVAWTLSASTFAEFDVRVQGAGMNISEMGYAAGGHFALGGNAGTLGDIYSSPGDPLFWLHYAQVDRLWDKWQREKWEARKGEIAGPDTQFAGPWEFYGEKEAGEVSVESELDFGGLFEGVKVGDVLDSGELCYRYE